MSTSGSGKRRIAGTHRRIAWRYAAAAAFCAVFALVYAQFAHGVGSPFMTFLFAVPLLAGAVPAIVLRAVRRPAPPVVARQAWALAVACVSVASCLRGVFDIAGTASPYLPAYLVAAAAFAAVAAGACIRARRGRGSSRNPQVTAENRTVSKN